MVSGGNGMEPDQGNATLIDKILIFDRDIAKFEHTVKTLKEQITDQIERLPEHAVVEQLAEQLKQTKEALKQATVRVPGLNDLQQQLADEKDALKQARLNLSDFLLGYFHETGERQIELEAADPREIVLSGKLKKAKGGQVSLFNQEGGE